MGSDYLLIDKTILEQLIKKAKEIGAAIPSTKRQSTVYSNKQVMKILHINDKLIRKYRELGLIGYSKVGDKYWYTRKDIEQFLWNNHYQAFV